MENNSEPLSLGILSPTPIKERLSIKKTFNCKAFIKMKFSLHIMICEADVIITFGVNETTNLYNLAKCHPCQLPLDSTGLIYHTLFCLYHSGFRKIVLLVPRM